MEPGTYKGYLKRDGEGKPVRVIVTLYKKGGRAMALSTRSMGWSSCSLDELILFPKAIEKCDWPLNNFWYERTGWQSASWSWVHSEKRWVGYINRFYWKVGGPGSKWRRKLSELRGQYVTDKEFSSIAQESELRASR